MHPRAIKLPQRAIRVPPRAIRMPPRAIRMPPRAMIQLRNLKLTRGISPLFLLTPVKLPHLPVRRASLHPRGATRVPQLEGIKLRLNKTTILLLGNIVMCSFMSYVLCANIHHTFQEMIKIDWHGCIANSNTNQHLMKKEKTDQKLTLVICLSVTFHFIHGAVGLLLG
jgi:hypothetical protein